MIARPAFYRPGWTRNPLHCENSATPLRRQLWDKWWRPLWNMECPKHCTDDEFRDLSSTPSPGRYWTFPGPTGCNLRKECEEVLGIRVVVKDLMNVFTTHLKVLNWGGIIKWLEGPWRSRCAAGFQLLENVLDNEGDVIVFTLVVNHWRIKVSLVLLTV